MNKIIGAYMHEFLDRDSKLYYEGTPNLKDHEFDILTKKQI